MKTTNLKSIKSELQIQLNNDKFSFEPQNSDKSEYSILATSNFDYKTLIKNDKINFNFGITYNGSNSVKFIPVGKVTTVALTLIGNHQVLKVHLPQATQQKPSTKKVFTPTGRFSTSTERLRSNTRMFYPIWMITCSE